MVRVPSPSVLKWLCRSPPRTSYTRGGVSLIGPGLIEVATLAASTRIFTDFFPRMSSLMQTTHLFKIQNIIYRDLGVLVLIHIHDNTNQIASKFSKVGWVPSLQAHAPDERSSGGFKPPIQIQTRLPIRTYLSTHHKTIEIIPIM